MKILFDHQSFSDQAFGGISRYFSMLMLHLRDHCNVEPVLGVRVSSNHYLRTISYPGYAHVPGELRIRGTRRIMKIVNGQYCRHLLSEGDFDIFHPTNYDPYFLDLLGSRPFVLTVYDLIHDLFPEEYAGEPYFRRWMELTTKSASAIIAISASTKRDLVRLYGVAPERVSVVYLGATEFRACPEPPERGLPDRFFLFVGDRQGYKNFGVLFDALPPLLSRDRSLHLVCAGGGRFSGGESKAIVSSGLEGRIHQFNASDDTLAFLYSKALALIYPSRYEGFGMPVLEALKCGCPVVASRTSSLPEIGGDAVLYVDPEDPENIRVTLDRVIDEPELRADLILKGRKRAQGFNWQRTAEETSQIYQLVIGRPS